MYYIFYIRLILSFFNHQHALKSIYLSHFERTNMFYVDKIHFCIRYKSGYSLISMTLIYYFNNQAIIWHGIVPVLIKICTDMITKMFLLLFLNNFRCQTITKIILRSYLCKSVQIFINPNNMISNDGSIIENMDLSHIHLACTWS
jgi:hypothetical protein